MNNITEARRLIEEMNTYYDRHAPLHDECMGYSSNDMMEALLGSIIDYFEAYIQHKDVLEIACGTGNWTQVLAKRARSVTATDVNSSVLDIARTKPFEKDNVSFRVADAYALDKMDGMFDVAFAADWWSHIPRLMAPEFLRSLHRRLRKNARVIFLDMTPRKEFDEEEISFDKEGNRISIRTLPDGREFRVVKNFPSERELRSSIGNSCVELAYTEFVSLKRWMLMYRTR